MLGDWDVTTGGRQKTLTLGFSPDDCRDNRVTVEGERFIVQANQGKARSAAVGKCSVASKIVVADADAWSDPLKLSASTGKAKPLACAVVNLDGQREIYWAMQDFKTNKAGHARRSAAGRSVCRGHASGRGDRHVGSSWIRPIRD